MTSSRPNPSSLPLPSLSLSLPQSPPSTDPPSHPIIIHRIIKNIINLLLPTSYNYYHMNFLKFFTSGTNLLNFSFSNPTIPFDNQIIFEDPAHTPSQIKPNNPTLPHGIQSPQLPMHLPPEAMKSKSLQQLLIKQQQQLLNECIKLNLQLINSNNKDQVAEEHPALNKRIKKVNRCEHTDKKHYAKGLCNNCYHRYGRSKRPWNCKHEVLYAAGMCQNCYINRYNKMRRDQQRKEVGEEGEGEGMGMGEDSQMIEETIMEENVEEVEREIREREEQKLKEKPKTLRKEESEEKREKVEK